ncbi:putative receptor-like protein kinase [Ananas comosus]|uniref:non-specific serine/threonine protein kinase n=1 Tax=Ananas comosus TaxID=4615 RepID=A0A199W3W2_ANACO|nr:putative receptor-like protein kinase [Ananas comosus]
MFWSSAAIAGTTAGGFAFLVIVLGFYYCYVFRRRIPSNRNSDTGSSDPSTLVEWNRGGRISTASCGPLVGDLNCIVVSRILYPLAFAVSVSHQRENDKQVKRLADIWHRNLVTLIGYCQEGGLQMVVSEYLPNGSVCGHLYDTGRDSVTRLEFKQRLSIAIGVAKGLSHLHSLAPPLVHKDFKTSNVLVDENFIAKVADAGIVRLVQRSEGVGSSHTSGCNIFLDPEVNSSGQLSESSDVYSFGVFLLELITGQEVVRHIPPEPKECLVQWVEAHFSSDELVDQRLGSSFTSEGMKELIHLTLRCLNPSGRGRPKMREIVAELDRILEMEMTLTTVMGDGTAIVTLGSQLFTTV